MNTPSLLPVAPPVARGRHRPSPRRGPSPVEYAGQRYLRLPGCQVLHRLAPPPQRDSAEGLGSRPATPPQHATAARLVHLALQVAYRAKPFQAITRPEFAPRVRIACRATVGEGPVLLHSVSAQPVPPLPPEHRPRPRPATTEADAPTEQARQLAEEFYAHQQARQQPAEVLELWGTFTAGRRLRPFAGTMSVGRKGAQLTHLEF